MKNTHDITVSATADQASKPITQFRDIPMFIRRGTWECDYPVQRALAWLDEEVRLEGLDLDPDFQRVHVWTEAQQIAWLEFFFRGGTTGRVVYLNNPDWSIERHGEKFFVLVDGKQRIQALRRFFSDEIPIFGSRFSQFTDPPDLIRQSIKININDLPTRADVLRWYIEMNSGGTPHTEAEIEKARALLAQEPAQSRRSLGEGRE